jgi:glycosyltransferase involved in cell wall biosynthesis
LEISFKALQYMAVGIPVVARRMAPVSEIGEDEVNGFLVETNDEWYERLQPLVRDADLRRAMGQAAGAKVVRIFSARAHSGSLDIPGSLEIATYCE